MSASATEQPDAWRLWPLREVKQRTSLSTTTIYDMMGRGEFPRARKIGGRVAWMSGDIIAWMQALPPVTLQQERDDGL